MKQAPYWIWTNSSQSNFVASANTSEEEAFAEDAAGRFGAFVWPPRAYHCSFCGREFRSAQALGGHMNVHRRDRARLKQSPSDPQSENPHHHHHQIQSCESRIVEYPDQTCTLVYNPDYNPSPRVSVSQVSPTRNLAPLTQESCYEDSLLLSAIQKRHKNSSSSFSSPPSWSDSDSVTVFGIGDSKKQGAKNSMKQMTVQDEGDTVKSNMSLNLNLVVDLEKGESFSCKRQRIDKEPLPFYLKPSSTIKCNLQSQITGLSTSTMEDVDLELRLGNRPKKLR